MRAAADEVPEAVDTVLDHGHAVPAHHRPHPGRWVVKDRYRACGPTTWLIAASVVVVACEAVFDFPRWMLDTVRAVELVEAVFIVAVSLAIARRYFQNYRAEPSRARLLPRHVARLGLMTVGFCISGVASVISVLGEDFSWYISPILLPTLTIGAVGLYDMVEWLPRRQTTAAPDGKHRRADD